MQPECHPGKNRPKKILRLTDEGYNLLGVEEEGTPAHYGGDEHRYMIEQVAKILSGNGWRVVIEADGCDVKAMYPDGRKKAVEVETCKEFNSEQILKNIQRDLMWAERVVIVNPNEETKQRIQRLVTEGGIEKVVLLTYADMPERLLEAV